MRKIEFIEKLTKNGRSVYVLLGLDGGTAPVGLKSKVNAIMIYFFILILQCSVKFLLKV
jgi:hypothetical protein